MRSRWLGGERPAVATELRHLPEIGNDCSGENLPPLVIRNGVRRLSLGLGRKFIGGSGDAVRAEIGNHAVANAEEFAPQRETRLFQLRIVQSEARRKHIEVLFQAGQRIRETAPSGDGRAIRNLADAALTNDVREEVSAGAVVGAEEVQFVVVGTGHEVDIARGEIELRLNLAVLADDLLNLQHGLQANFARGPGLVLVVLNDLIQQRAVVEAVAGLEREPERALIRRGTVAKRPVSLAMFHRVGRIHERPLAVVAQLIDALAGVCRRRAEESGEGRQLRRVHRETTKVERIPNPLRRPHHRAARDGQSPRTVRDLYEIGAQRVDCVKFRKESFGSRRREVRQPARLVKKLLRLILDELHGPTRQVRPDARHWEVREDLGDLRIRRFDLEPDRVPAIAKLEGLRDRLRARGGDKQRQQEETKQCLHKWKSWFKECQTSSHPAAGAVGSSAWAARAVRRAPDRCGCRARASRPRKSRVPPARLCREPSGGARAPSPRPVAFGWPHASP